MGSLSILPSDTDWDFIMNTFFGSSSSFQRMIGRQPNRHDDHSCIPKIFACRFGIVDIVFESHLLYPKKLTLEI